MTNNKNRKYFFRADDDETFLIERKFSNSGLSSKSEFFRHMILDGYLITADGELLDKLLKLLGNTSNIKAYYINGKPPKQCDLEQRLIELKSKYNSLVPEHNAFITRRDTAMKYTRQVRQYLNEQHMKREREKSKQRVQAKHKNSYIE